MSRLLRRVVATAHFLLASVIGGVAFVALSAWGALHVLVRGREGQTHVLMARAYARLMTAVLGWRVEVENAAGLVEPSPAIVMVRHQSNVDVILLGGAFPRGTYAIGKKELERFPFFGRVWTASGNFLVDRRSLPSAIEAIRAAAARATEERFSIWVSPEGHRNPGRELLPFKKGVFHLAVATGFPVVPVAVDPVDTVFDARRFAARPGKVRIRVLPPVPTAGLGRDDVDALSSRVRSLLQGAQDELAASAGEPIAPRR